MNHEKIILEPGILLGVTKKDLESLAMPKKIIFMDLDGTIIPDDSPDGQIDEADLIEFKHVVCAWSQMGVSVGLNSDSPLPQLSGFAAKIGLTGPIIAENGNIISFKGKSVVVKQVEDLNNHKEKIRNIAECLGFKQDIDCINPTFGGQKVDFQSGCWAFGANRQTSISVFGPYELISKLGNLLLISGSESVDCSPEYNYFALHPGNYHENKGLMLNMLADHGHDILMIGNSLSDWVKPDHLVKCAFVGGARINGEVSSDALYVSKLPTIKGVIDILKHITI